MENTDLCLAWNWEHDADFVTILDQTFRSKGLSLLQATPQNLNEVLRSLSDQQIGFIVFLDRASEHDARFAPLIQWVGAHGISWINSHEHVARACNKAVMHYTLINAGLYTPYTIVLPSYEEKPILPVIDLQPLGERFIIKPAHGGGGDGVIMKANSLNEALIARREHFADQYLLQAYITPREIDSRPAWFRVIYCTGRTYPCWWHPRSHIYAPVTTDEEERYGLNSLHNIMATIARLSGLDLLSSEIAFTTDGLFVVIDYVNDQIDLRLQSKAVDGVPDFIVHDVAERLAGLVGNYERSLVVK